MRKSYLFVYNSEVGSREDIKNYLNSLPQIINWRYDIPNMFYLISEDSAKELSRLIRQFSKQKGRFIIAEVGNNKYGWLPGDAWSLLNKKLSPDGT